MTAVIFPGGLGRRRVIMDRRAGRGVAHGHMDNWLGGLAFLGVWFVLQAWLLPRMGVPT
jgi:hypothetical protein